MQICSVCGKFFHTIMWGPPWATLCVYVYVWQHGVLHADRTRENQRAKGESGGMGIVFHSFSATSAREPIAKHSKCETTRWQKCIECKGGVSAESNTVRTVAWKATALISVDAENYLGSSFRGSVFLGKSIHIHMTHSFTAYNYNHKIIIKIAIMMRNQELAWPC